MTARGKGHALAGLEGYHLREAIGVLARTETPEWLENAPAPFCRYDAGWPCWPQTGRSFPMRQVRDVMTSKPTTCSVEASVADAAKAMAQEDVGPIPIMEGDRLVGILTDRDIVVRVVAEGRDPQSTTVGEVASTDLATVAPDESLDRALQLLAEQQVRRLPVVEGETLVGVVAQADIAGKVMTARRARS
jgi:CBS domain-containing protein